MTEDNIIENDQPISPSDLHAIALISQLSEREADVLFGEAEDVSYEEYSEVINKLLEMDDIESAIRLRKKYDTLVEEFGDSVLHEKRDYTPREPVITTPESMAYSARKSKEAFPETNARIQEMIDLGQKRIDQFKYADKETAREERKNRVALTLGLLDQIKGKINEENWREAALESYREWQEMINYIRGVIQSDDFEASDAAIKKINELYLFSRLNDAKWLSSEVRSLYRHL